MFQCGLGAHKRAFASAAASPTEPFHNCPRLTTVIYHAMMGKTWGNSRDDPPMGKLTVSDIRTLAAPGYYAAGFVPGLYLCIAKGGSKSWIYRFQMNGRR